MYRKGLRWRILPNDFGTCSAAPTGKPPPLPDIDRAEAIVRILAAGMSGRGLIEPAAHDDASANPIA
jgi:hypothetical protein